jgi:hypothetical protein
VLHINYPGAWQIGDTQLTAMLLGRIGLGDNMASYIDSNPNMTEIVIPFIQLHGCWRLLLDGGGPRLGLTANDGKHIRHLTRLELAALPSHPYVLQAIGRCCPHMQTLALLGNDEADNSWDAADLGRLTNELKELRDLTLFAQDVRTHWYVQAALGLGLRRQTRVAGARKPPCGARRASQGRASPQAALGLVQSFFLGGWRVAFGICCKKWQPLRMWKTRCWSRAGQRGFTFCQRSENGTWCS